MYKFCLLLLPGLLLAPVVVHSQNVYTLNLFPDTINIQDRDFYIHEVFDERANKDHIGLVTLPGTQRLVPAHLRQGLADELQQFFDLSMPGSGEQKRITLVVRKFEVVERETTNMVTCQAVVTFEFLSNGRLVYSTTKGARRSDRDKLKSHEANLREAVKRAVIDFSNSGWDGSTEYQKNRVLDGEKANHILAVGYQIGGITLVGAEYELRVDEYVGLNLGAGLRGYTVGLKFHTNPRRNSSFFNISYKDGGFGLISTAAIEYGGKIPFSRKNNFGFHGQIGLAKVLKINESFEFDLFKGKPAPPVLLSVGAGFSW